MSKFDQQLEAWEQLMPGMKLEVLKAMASNIMKLHQQLLSDQQSLIKRQVNFLEGVRNFYESCDSLYAERISEVETLIQKEQNKSGESVP